MSTTPAIDSLITRVRRVDMSESNYHEDLIKTCDAQRFDGFKLAASYVVNTDLILIFQKI